MGGAPTVSMLGLCLTPPHSCCSSPGAAQFFYKGPESKYFRLCNQPLLQVFNSSASIQFFRKNSSAAGWGVAKGKQSTRGVRLEEALAGRAAAGHLQCCTLGTYFPYTSPDPIKCKSGPPKLCPTWVQLCSDKTTSSRADRYPWPPDHSWSSPALAGLVSEVLRAPCSFLLYRFRCYSLPCPSPHLGISFSTCPSTSLPQGSLLHTSGQSRSSPSRPSPPPLSFRTTYHSSNCIINSVVSCLMSVSLPRTQVPVSYQGLLSLLPNMSGIFLPHCLYHHSPGPGLRLVSPRPLQQPPERSSWVCHSSA